MAQEWRKTTSSSPSIVSVYDFLQQSQAVIVPVEIDRPIMVYPCIEGCFSKEEVEGIAREVIDELEILKHQSVNDQYKQIRSGKIFNEAASQLSVYMNGESMGSGPDHPFDKGLFNMSFLWYLAFDPSQETMQKKIASHVQIKSNPGFDHWSEPLESVKGDEHLIAINGINGFDPVFRSSIGTYKVVTRPDAVYHVVATEVRRSYDPSILQPQRGEFDVALIRETGEVREFYIETLLGPHLKTYAGLGKFSPPQNAFDYSLSAFAPSVIFEKEQKEKEEKEKKEGKEKEGNANADRIIRL